MSNYTPNNFVAQQANTVGVVDPSNSHSIPSMPKHMRLDEWPLPYPLSVLFQCIFTGLCILATGHTTLEHFLNTAEDGEMWNREKMLITTRLNQNNVIGGLFVATIAGWPTSSPPAYAMLNYTTRGSYVCLFISFTLVWGSIIVGSAVLYAMPMVTGTWLRMTLMRSRSCVCGTLLIITYPFPLMTAGTITAIIGFLIAAFNSQDWLIQVSTIFLVLILSSLVVGFACSQLLMFVWRNKGGMLAATNQQFESFVHVERA